MPLSTLRMSLAVVALASMNNSASADYIATEKPYAYVCKSYIIFSNCTPVSINAVRDRDGKLFEMRDTFPENWITEYRDQLCTINMKTSNPGMLALLGRSQQFLSKNEKGDLYEISPEYIQFNCKKSP